MSIIESIIDDSALDWFGGLGYEEGPGQQHAPSELAAHGGSFGDVLFSRLREANCQLNLDSSKAPQTPVADFPTVQYNCWLNP